MKKLLGFLVLGLLFISIDLSNSTRVEAETLQELINRTHMSKTEKFFHKLNPLNYFEKRKDEKAFRDLGSVFFIFKQSLS